MCMPVSMRRNGRWSGQALIAASSASHRRPVDRALVAAGVGEPLLQRLDLVRAHVRRIETRRANGRRARERKQAQRRDRRASPPPTRCFPSHGVPRKTRGCRNVSKVARSTARVQCARPIRAPALPFVRAAWQSGDVRRMKEPRRLRIATWNVNSVRQRLPHLLDYLKEAAPDALCLQEIKCLDEAFPRAEVEALGYNVETHGQKTFNGVAILAKRPFEVARGLPGDGADVQSRYIEAVIPAGDRVVRVASIYLPNGNPTGTEKYAYKLAFMDRLIAHARKLLEYEEPLALTGDFNVIPEPRDAAHPEQWAKDALFLPETRAKFRELLALGFIDALRATTDAGGLYTFWDYQAGAWQKDNGIRIDHLLLSPQAADRLQSVTIDKAMRGRDKASDHTPIRADLAL